MAIYNVLVDIVGTASVMVEADNEADAEEVAIEAVNDGEGEIDCQLPTNKLAGLQLRKMFPRRIWPVDFGLAYPHRTPLPRTVLATYSGKCRHMPHTQAKDCSYHALRSILHSEHPNLGSRISPVYRSA